MAIIVLERRRVPLRKEGSYLLLFQKLDGVAQLFQGLLRQADRSHDEPASQAGARFLAQTSLGGHESHGHVGLNATPFGLAAVAIQAGGDIDREGKTTVGTGAVHPRDSLGSDALRRSPEAGAEEGVYRHIPRSQRRERARLMKNSQLLPTLEVIECRTGTVSGIPAEDDLWPQPLLQQIPGRHQSVPAVVARSCKDHQPSGPRRTGLQLSGLRHCAAGVLHQ